jgi:hypothetical protein
MDRYLVSAGLFAVAGALCFQALVPDARAEGARFSKCTIIETVFVTNHQSPDDPKFAGKLAEIPEGWTPIGGGSSLSPPLGVIAICK